MAASRAKDTPKVTASEAKRFHWLMGTHQIYLGNILAGVLNVTFANSPWPTHQWMLFRPKGEYLEDLVAEANDDPKYDDKIKECIKAGKKAPWAIVEHWYAALMAEGLAAFIVFNCKNNLFKDAWPENHLLATVVYLIAGLGSAYAIYASTKRKWVESSFPAVMAAGLLSTICLIFMDKGGVSPKRARQIFIIKKWLPAFACSATRRYKKKPSKLTTLKHRKLGLILVLILFPLNLWTMKYWFRNGVTGLAQGTFTTGLPYKEFHYCVRKYPKTYFGAAKMLTLDFLGKDKYKNKKAVQFAAAIQVEVYIPLLEEEMTPKEAREILQVEEGADKKRLHKAYRDASRRYHPDKYSGGKEEAEKMQEKVGIARTILGFYPDRFDDAKAQVAIGVARFLGRDIPAEFLHKVEKKPTEVDLDDDDSILMLAETQCEAMLNMYMKLVNEDLVDLGMALGATPDCLTLAQNFKDMARIEVALQKGEEPVPFILEAEVEEES